MGGGTDLLPQVRDGVVAAGRLVGLAAIPELAAIEETADGGLSIGAAATIADVASHPLVRRYAALAEAAGGLATPQIRNEGTIGGNLAQRPRCWYYRSPLIPCLKKGGDRCYALAGNTRLLCVTGGDRCYIVHPSDTAVALSALDARIEIIGPNGRRDVVISEFFAGPGKDLLRENVLEPNEVIARIVLPAVPSGSQRLPQGPRARVGRLCLGQRRRSHHAGCGRQRRRLPDRSRRSGSRSLSRH